MAFDLGRCVAEVPAEQAAEVCCVEEARPSGDGGDGDGVTVPDEWISYAVEPTSVEFWQGDPERRHQRLRYDRDGGRWRRSMLWP